MFTIFLVVGIFVLGVLFVTTWINGREITAVQRAQGTYFKRNYFFSNQSETAFFRELLHQVGSKYHVLAQVNIDKLLYTKKGDRSSRNQIDRKSVDFALLDYATLSPVLAIELDGHSHDREDRMVRDVQVEQTFAQAKLPLKRIKVGADFRTEIEKMLSEL